MANPFQIADPTAYSPDRFYTSSTNRHDHSKNVQVPVPKDLYAMMAEWVDKIPDYRSVQDLMRDACRHRLQQLEDRYPGIVDEMLLAEYDLADRIEQVRTRVKLRKQLVHDAEAAADEAERAGDRDQMVALVGLYEGMLERLDEEVARDLGKTVKTMRDRLKFMDR